MNGPRRAANTLQVPMQDDRSMCAPPLHPPPPCSAICYPTSEPPKMRPEDGQLGGGGMLQGRKDLK